MGGLSDGLVERGRVPRRVPPLAEVAGGPPERHPDRVWAVPV